MVNKAEYMDVMVQVTRPARTSWRFNLVVLLVAPVVNVVATYSANHTALHVRGPTLAAFGFVLLAAETLVYGCHLRARGVDHFRASAVFAGMATVLASVILFVVSLIALFLFIQATCTGWCD